MSVAVEERVVVVEGVVVRDEAVRDGVVRAGVADQRAAGALPWSSVDVVAVWDRAMSCACGELPEMGLAAGARPGADVELLAGAFAAVEYELARRMHAATTAGSLPLVGPGALLSARGWATPQARRLARTGALAAAHPSVAAAWAAGIITSDHVDAVARNVGPLTREQIAAVIGELAARWGQWSPPMIAKLVIAAVRLLHPPQDEAGRDEAGRDEADAHASRGLSFALLGDTVLLSGSLPRLEGEAVIAAIDAMAERLRSTADLIPAGARRADALVELVNTAAASGRLPTRGGLPVALTVILDHTGAGDPVWTTSRGHLLTGCEQRFVACDATITPIAVATPGPPAPDPGSFDPRSLDPGCVDPGCVDPGCFGQVALDPGSLDLGSSGRASTAGGRIAALAALLFDGPRLPLAVGRTARIATPAQRRALAARDGGCVIPGCQVPAETCQVHHVREWAEGGSTDIENLASLCWSHHRQVDLGMWTIEAAVPAVPTELCGPTEPGQHAELGGHAGLGVTAGAPPGTPWPGNNASPWTILAQPRSRWRL